MPRGRICKLTLSRRMAHRLNSVRQRRSIGEEDTPAERHRQRGTEREVRGNRRRARERVLEKGGLGDALRLGDEETKSKNHAALRLPPNTDNF